MTARYPRTLSNDSSRAVCLQLVGFDFVVDAALKPWLVEINGNPYLTVDHVDRMEEKLISSESTGMVKDMVSALGSREKSRPRYDIVKKRVMEAASMEGALKSSGQRLTSIAISYLANPACNTTSRYLGLFDAYPASRFSSTQQSPDIALLLPKQLPAAESIGTWRSAVQKLFLRAQTTRSSLIAVSLTGRTLCHTFRSPSCACFSLASRHVGPVPAEAGQRHADQTFEGQASQEHLHEPWRIPAHHVHLFGLGTGLHTLNCATYALVMHEPLLKHNDKFNQKDLNRACHINVCDSERFNQLL